MFYNNTFIFIQACLSRYPRTPYTSINTLRGSKQHNMIKKQTNRQTWRRQSKKTLMMGTGCSEDGEHYSEEAFCWDLTVVIVSVGCVLWGTKSLSTHGDLSNATSTKRKCRVETGYLAWIKDFELWMVSAIVRLITHFIFISLLLSQDLRP